MTVKIEIFGDTAKDTLSELRDLAAGFASDIREGARHVTAFANLPAEPEPKAFVGGATDNPAVVQTNTPRAGESEEQTAARRERGKPAPGRARRTKEEIAEDEAADKADAEAAAARGSISSDPENRVGPEDEPEVQEQDKADEQAEVEASRDAETPLTGEDVRSAMGLYVKKFGLPATQEDGASIFLDALGTPPKGAEGWKLSVVSEQDQPTLRKAIDAWTSAANAEARYVAKGGA